jgi:hypothetical protein
MLARTLQPLPFHFWTSETLYHGQPSFMHPEPRIQKDVDITAYHAFSSLLDFFVTTCPLHL